jgi:hypothetical protein
MTCNRKYVLSYIVYYVSTFSNLQFRAVYVRWDEEQQLLRQPMKHICIPLGILM